MKNTDIAIREEPAAVLVLPVSRQAGQRDRAHLREEEGGKLLDPLSAYEQEAERMRKAGPRRRFGRYDDFPPAHSDGTTHEGTSYADVEASRHATVWRG